MAWGLGSAKVPQAQNTASPVVYAELLQSCTAVPVALCNNVYK